MKKLLVFSLVVAAVAVVTLFSVGMIGYAQGPGGSWSGGMMEWGGRQNSLVASAAQTLGMTQADLVSAMQSGKTIADVAKAKGIALDKIVDAFLTARQAMLKTAVAGGRLTQAQADSMIGIMKANVLARLSAPFTPRGTGFMDADNDGLCDNCRMMGGQRMGQQNGPGWNR